MKQALGEIKESIWSRKLWFFKKVGNRQHKSTWNISNGHINLVTRLPLEALLLDIRNFLSLCFPRNFVRYVYGECLVFKVKILVVSRELYRYYIRYSYTLPLCCKDGILSLRTKFMIVQKCICISYRKILRTIWPIFSKFLIFHQLLGQWNISKMCEKLGKYEPYRMR